MFKSSFVESQSFFNKYVKSAIQNKKKEQQGVVLCQRCLKYGHYTYECKNEVKYTYRPSRTMQYKEKQLQYNLSNDKPPETAQVWDGDRKRTLYVRKEDEELSVVSSSSSEAEEIVKKEEKVQTSSSDDSSEDTSSDSDDSSSSESESPKQKKKLPVKKVEEQPKKKVEVSRKNQRSRSRQKKGKK